MLYQIFSRQDILHADQFVLSVMSCMFQHFVSWHISSVFCHTTHNTWVSQWGPRAAAESRTEFDRWRRRVDEDRRRAAAAEGRRRRAQDPPPAMTDIEAKTTPYFLIYSPPLSLIVFVGFPPFFLHNQQSLRTVLSWRSGFGVCCWRGCHCSSNILICRC